MDRKQLDELITHRPQKELQADHAWRLYNSLQEMIRFADYKIYLLYMIAGLILSVVFRDFKETIEINVVFKLLFGALIVSSGLLVYFSMNTVMPRSMQVKNTESNKLIFFNDIAHQTTKEYIENFLTPPTSVITEDVLTQVTVLSRILREKFENLKRAMIAFYAIIALILIIQFMEMII
ncbi:MAG: Pycsar system effector family protein [Saprospiraceae bacterium]